MNYIKRGLLSISRKKTKSLLLFLIIFILGNVMAGAIAIRQGADNVEKNIKQQLGAVVTLDVDYQAFEKQMQENPENPPEWPQALDSDMLTTIGQSSYVKSYDFTTQTTLGSENLEPWLDPEYAEWAGDDPYRKYYGFNLKGTEYPPVMLIEEGKATLIDGRTFTQEEITRGTGSALIHTQLAEYNNLSVGDNIVLSNYILEYSEDGMSLPTEVERRDVPLQIIGIYETIEQPQTPNDQMIRPAEDKQTTYNTLLVPNQVIIAEQRAMTEYYMSQESMDLTDEEKEQAMQTYYQSLYILNNPDDMEAFKEETQALLPPFYTIYTNSDSYSVIAAPVQQTSKMANYVLIAAIGASILIISLVVLLFLRDRKHELGIYMSLGEKRSKVISQIVFEVMLVAILAIALSLVTGNFIAQGLSDSMVHDQLVAETDPMNPDQSYWDEQWRFGQFASNITSEDIAENYRISFSPSYVGLFFLIGLGTVLVSTVVPMLYIVRLNPKQVLM